MIYAEGSRGPETEIIEMASLIQALEEGRYRQFQILLDVGCNIDYRGKEDGMTPLMKCCYIKDDKAANTIFRKLLRSKSNLALVDRKEQGILHHVVLSKKLSLLKQLLDRDSEVMLTYSQIDIQGKTALHHATAIGSFQCVKRLIVTMQVQHIGIDGRDGTGMTPLMLACKHGNLEVARLLVHVGRASLTMRDDVYFRNARDWLAQSVDFPPYWDPFKNGANIRPSEDIKHGFMRNHLLHSSMKNGKPLLDKTKSSKYEQSKVISPVKTDKSNADTRLGYFTPIPYFAYFINDVTCGTLSLRALGEENQSVWTPFFEMSGILNTSSYRPPARRPDSRKSSIAEEQEEPLGPVKQFPRVSFSALTKIKSVLEVVFYLERRANTRRRESIEATLETMELSEDFKDMVITYLKAYRIRKGMTAAQIFNNEDLPNLAQDCVKEKGTRSSRRNSLSSNPLLVSHSSTSMRAIAASRKRKENVKSKGFSSASQSRACVLTEQLETKTPDPGGENETALKTSASLTDIASRT